MSRIELVGFHGTDVNNVVSIQNEGFRSSMGDEHWLGDGAYFFIAGLCDPSEAAGAWANVSAWDNQLKKHRYDRYAILRTDIFADEKNVLDLTKEEGVKLLNYIRDQCKKKLLEKRQNTRLDYIDGFLINFARERILPELRITIASMFIKLTKEERIENLARRTPNCTICAVATPKECVCNISVIKISDVTV